MDRKRLLELAGVPYKEEMCSTACCGVPVSECHCGPECPHCDCYDRKKKKKLKEGAMMDDGGTYIFDQNNAIRITIRANDQEEAQRKLDEVIREANDIGIEFADAPFEVVSSY